MVSLLNCYLFFDNFISCVLIIFTPSRTPLRPTPAPESNLCCHCPNEYGSRQAPSFHGGFPGLTECLSPASAPAFPVLLADWKGLCPVPDMHSQTWVLKRSLDCKMAMLSYLIVKWVRRLP